MPLVVWSPSSHLAYLAEKDRYTTRLRSYDAGVDIDEELSNPWLWIYCEKANTDFLLFTVSPTYALLIPSVALSTDFSYGHRGMMVRGADSSWDPSLRQGKLYLYNLVGFFSALNTYTELNGHLDIETKVAPGSMVSPRLLPQFLL